MGAPFGWSLDKERLVDVSEVKNGEKCNCICPSCKIPLVARHCAEKEDHFAHNKKFTQAQEYKDCEYSYHVAIRQMIRQLLSEGSQFKTPALAKHYHFDDHTSKQEVVSSQVISYSDVSTDVRCFGTDNLFDAVLTVNNQPLHIFVTYEGRPFSLPNDLHQYVGIIKMDIRKMNFKDAKGVNSTKLMLKHTLEESLDFKEWAYHKRQAKNDEIYLDFLDKEECELTVELAVKLQEQFSEERLCSLSRYQSYKEKMDNEKASFLCTRCDLPIYTYKNRPKPCSDCNKTDKLELLSSFVSKSKRRC